MSKQNNLTDFLTDVADAIRQKKGTQAPINPQDFSSEIASIPTGGITPTGNINITDTTQTDVAAYATAQVVDANLIAANIKKDITILGILGTLEGGTDGLDELMQEKF